MTLFIKTEDKQMFKSAQISDDGQYRYQLIRIWDSSLPILGFIMLNPSTADGMNDDPTVRECISMAKRWGYGGIIICNLFAFRATKPPVMMQAADPIGPDNNWWLRNLCNNVSTIVLAWGTRGGYLGRAKEVIRILTEEWNFPKEKLMCLGVCNNGEPNHPLGVVGPYQLRSYLAK